MQRRIASAYNTLQRNFEIKLLCLRSNMTPLASKSNIDLMNHISDMILHLNILNTALLMRLSSIYIEDLLGETASSAYEITGTQKDLNN